MNGRADERASSLVISVLSAHPSAVSGGNARLRVAAPPGIKISKLHLMVGGVDRTGQLVRTAAGLEGVVDGLVDGPNYLKATGPKGLVTKLTVVNHPISGPVLSGPRSGPFICQTAHFKLATGESLGAPLDRDCSITSRVGYLYRSSESETFKVLPAAAVTDRAQRPRDLAQVTLPSGLVRPFIVRVEASSIDRGISQVAMLDDPTAPLPTSSDTAAGDDGTWNRKLIYAFGGSCGGGSRQGTRTVGVLSPSLLAQGYAVASSSLNAFEQNCNDVVAAEAFSMTREQFIETHGLPTYTMGIGCSGGAAQAYGIADNYPGMLDGIVAGCGLADVGTDAAQIAFDARLLHDFASRHPATLSGKQLQAVSGLESLTKLSQLSDFADVLDPVAGLDASVPVFQRYNARTNPRGVRGTIYDQAVPVYGSVTSHGVTRARRPLGNVGVQYGLTALQQHTISVDQFLALNAGIGGLDTDLKPTAARTVADPDATARAYSTGRVLGGLRLGDIPIIDYRSYGYQPQTVGLDIGVQSLIVRSRLIKANGDADNMVIYSDADHGRFDLEGGVVATAIRQMDRWILATQAIGRPGHEGVVRARPPEVTDACTTDQDGRISRGAVADQTGDRCDQLFPPFTTPRIAAGGPLSSNVLSCALVPPAVADYGRPFTLAQQARLRAIFPTGVCDWSQPGLGQRRATKVWQTF